MDPYMVFVKCIETQSMNFALHNGLNFNTTPLHGLFIKSFYFLNWESWLLLQIFFLDPSVYAKGIFRSHFFSVHSFFVNVNFFGKL